MVKNAFKPPSGFTLTELLMTLVIVSMVFLGATSLYMTGLKFLGARQNVDITTAPAVAVEQVVRNVSLANSVSLTQGNSQLNVRLDYSCAGVALATPETTGDDTYWHYRFMNTELLSYCDTTPGPTVLAGNNPPGTSAIAANVDTTGGGSTFALINPSAIGTATVVSIHFVSNVPAITIDTEVALGASPKR